MFGLIGCALNMSAPSPLTRRREYEAYLRTPASSPADNFATREAYRLALWHEARISAFPAPQDSFANEFGLVESGRVTIVLADDSRADSYAYILLEDGGYALLEDGSNLLQE